MAKRTGTQALPSAGEQNAAVHRIDARMASKRHAQVQFLVGELERLGLPSFAHGTQSVEEGAADIGALGAKGQRLEDVLAGPDAAVHVHLDAPAHRLHYRGQGRA